MAEETIRRGRGTPAAGGLTLLKRFVAAAAIAASALPAFLASAPACAAEPASAASPAAAACLVDLESGQTILAEHSDEPIESDAALPAVAAYAALAQADRTGKSLGSPLAEAPSAAESEASPANEKSAGEAAAKPAEKSTDQATEAEGNRPRAGAALSDALRALLAASSADPLKPLADSLFGGLAAMADAMNAEAKALGLKRTAFRADGGRIRTIRTSAEDAALAAEALYRDYPVARLLAAAPGADFGGRVLPNTNFFLSLSNAVTGLTVLEEPRGWSGLILAENPRRSGRVRRLAAAVLGAPGQEALRERISTMLLRAYRDYDTIQIFKAGDAVAELPLYRGEADSVAAVAEEAVFATLSRERMLERGSNAVEIRIERQAPLAAPIAAGERLGEAVVFVDGRPIGRTPIAAAADVKEAGFWKRLADTVRMALDARSGRAPAAGPAAPPAVRAKPDTH